MDINTNPMTWTEQSSAQLSLPNGFAMPTRALTSGCTQAFVAIADLTIEQAATIARTRKVSTKGHVALAAYVPGIHAWSPPLC